MWELNFAKQLKNTLCEIRTVGVSGFGFRVSSFGFRVSGFGFRISGSGFGFRVSGFGFRVLGSGFGFRVSGFVLRPEQSQSGLRISLHGVSWYRLRMAQCKDYFKSDFSTGLWVEVSFKGHCVVGRAVSPGYATQWTTKGFCE